MGPRPSELIPDGAHVPFALKLERFLDLGSAKDHSALEKGAIFGDQKFRDFYDQTTPSLDRAFASLLLFNFCRHLECSASLAIRTYGADKPNLTLGLDHSLSAFYYKMSINHSINPECIIRYANVRSF